MGKSSRRIEWIIWFTMLNACVQPIDFEVPEARYQLIVDGMISDEPGPYTVTLSNGLVLDAFPAKGSPVENATVKLYDDEGKVELLTEDTAGVYVTSGLIRGRIGHAYHIEIETAGGERFVSAPETISPVGNVEAIRFEYEARTVKKNYGEVDANVFNIFIDANTGESDEPYIRWRFTGTFQIVTYPELHFIWNEGPPYKDPLPCSGYIVEPALGGGKLTKVAECTCCTCWVEQFETIPHLSDGQSFANHEVRNIKVAEVPINSTTFSDKYRIEVEQMSLTRTAFEFFKLIRTQKEGASSIFQPPSGEIKGNLSATNNNVQVVGLFWATSISRKYQFITRDDVPYKLTPMDVVTDACTTFSHSTTQKPDLWQ